jgi:hypothetical protein
MPSLLLCCVGRRPKSFSKQHEQLENDGPSVDLVTRLSQPAADQESRRGTARDDYDWSGRVESHCETAKFSLGPTGGQVVAGSNPVSPTQPDSALPQVKGALRNSECVDELVECAAVEQ